MESYKLRIERKRLRIRALRRARIDLELISDRSERISRTDILVFTTLRNERDRLPFFLDYYRKLGVRHFFIVDNGSTDGSGEYLKKQKDVSLWHSDASYKRAAYGMHWLNALMSKKAVGHWCLVVDVDEFFVYPHCDSRSLYALTDWLEASSVRSFGALLIDLYPKGLVEDAKYNEGENPVKVAPYFDSGNYTIGRNPIYENLWIQGGPRQRVFFKDKPMHAPALNKIPLVKWVRINAYRSSTHTILPRSLNLVYDRNGGQSATGCLLHTKFLDSFSKKVSDEKLRKQHYAASREYERYSEISDKETTFYTPNSTKYEDWRQLEKLGLMSSGGWA